MPADCCLRSTTERFARLPQDLKAVVDPNSSAPPSKQPGATARGSHSRQTALPEIARRPPGQAGQTRRYRGASVPQAAKGEQAGVGIGALTRRWGEQTVAGRDEVRRRAVPTPPHRQAIPRPRPGAGGRQVCPPLSPVRISRLFSPGRATDGPWQRQNERADPPEASASGCSPS